MFRKFTTLSLALLLCASVLPAQAGAMYTPEDEPAAQVEKSEVQIPVENANEDADAGIAPCFAVAQDPNSGCGASIPPVQGPANKDGAGRPYIGEP